MFEESARLVVWLVPIILLAVIILPQMIRILREYERGVIFRLGKLLGTKGPGLIFLIPIVDRMVRMDLRVVTIDVARQEVMTRDNVPMTVDAVVYFRVIDPAATVVRVEKYLKATSLISQTTLRSVLGQAELDELLSQRDKINLRLQEIIDRQTDPWGIKVTAVEVRDVTIGSCRCTRHCRQLSEIVRRLDGPGRVPCGIIVNQSAYSHRAVVLQLLNRTQLPSIP